MSDKYKKFLGKEEEITQEEEKTIHTTKSGIVERQKKVMIVTESGEKKQLLREQV